MAFLNESGLAYFLAKIKAWCNASFASLGHSLSVVLSGNGNAVTNITVSGHAITATKSSTFLTSQDITGKVNKSGDTMTGNLTVPTVIVSGSFVKKHPSITKGTNPSTTNYWSLIFADKDGSNFSNNCLGMLETSISATGVVSTYIRAMKNTAANSSNCQISCIYDTANNTAYTAAPTPATSDNSTKIATTAFVKAQGYITSSGSITGSAAKLGTSTVGSSVQPIYLNAGTAAAVSSALKSCYAVVESEAVTKNIFKIASGSMGYAYNGLNLVILIQNIMGVNAAVWRISLNAGSTAGVYSAGTSVLVDNIGLNPANFIVAYKSNSGGSLNFELYTKIAGRYSGYRFTVIQECWRASQELGNILTLYNQLTTTGTAAITSGYTALTTTNGTVSMSIDGNAGTATNVTGIVAVANGGTGHNGTLTQTTAADFNSYNTAGEYHVRFTSSTQNAPESTTGTLDCILRVTIVGSASNVSSSGRIIQEAIVLHTSSTKPDKYIRKGYSGGTWYSWYKFTTA